MKRCRKCFCMNNDEMQNCSNNNSLENACNNIISDEQNYNENCSCGFDDDNLYNVLPLNPNLAQSYVPIQIMNETFKPCPGLKYGTIYPELVSPYEPCDSMRQIKYLESSNEIGEGCNGCGRE